ncbi:basic salivary proline-rich protein 2-like [Lynx canadensis]|uniref:basic salivary proline-rich protein 2-like n=1 Tax=Lynx canadensis TaxID=61383 RepID=UPI0011B0644E|nr:basic salivary proline-rich protein 2-like [Lynx canadensis]
MRPSGETRASFPPQNPLSALSPPPSFQGSPPGRACRLPSPFVPTPYFPPPPPPHPRPSATQAPPKLCIQGPAAPRAPPLGIPRDPRTPHRGPGRPGLSVRSRSGPSGPLSLGLPGPSVRGRWAPPAPRSPAPAALGQGPSPGGAAGRAGGGPAARADPAGSVPPPPRGAAKSARSPAAAAARTRAWGGARGGSSPPPPARPPALAGRRAAPAAGGRRSMRRGRHGRYCHRRRQAELQHFRPPPPASWRLKGDASLLRAPRRMNLSRRNLNEPLPEKGSFALESQYWEGLWDPNNSSSPTSRSSLPPPLTSSTSENDTSITQSPPRDPSDTASSLNPTWSTPPSSASAALQPEPPDWSPHFLPCCLPAFTVYYSNGLSSP